MDPHAVPPYDGDEAPPAYSSGASTEYSRPRTSDLALSPSQTSVSSLNADLQVPSRSSRVTSGFEYPPILSRYDISEYHWKQFSAEITNGAKLTGLQWTSTVGKGLGVLALGGFVIGFFSTVPAAITIHNLRKDQERQNLSAATTMGLLQKIEEWNGLFFKPRGVVVRLEMPQKGSSRRRKEGEGQGQTHQDGRRGNKESERARIVVAPLPASGSLESQDEWVGDRKLRDI
ncbi:hypothetical protein ASPZODRAFT_126685 [Penicilliopsis zonata CBS 506.65]|uniref:Uncharacterized protein n=1 Tax=Penicilliopsis zonata CBS 506.65 TaxID=1073090 RepID=A0A1L9SU83_9EURO|nr:hypothetical protein ASPZODRAFT_126685 [Penicilliopsis zonata CBS 506.65]OJJ50760.1 hypothetical protein ASPZODRAFT_126685 [Penicilliopsis zonata CBS 506.65]